MVDLQMEQRLIEALSNSISAENQARHEAEETIKQA
jgi:hypothetical protein